MVRITYNSGFLPAIQAELKRRIVRATHSLKAGVKEAVSRQGSKLVHSKPGEPPMTQSGALARSAEVVENADGAKLVLARHGAILEEGTGDTDPRPFIRKTLSRLKPQLAEDITRPMT